MEWINVKKEKPPLDTPIMVFERFKYGDDIKIAEYVRPFNKKRPVFGIHIKREDNGYVYGGYPLDHVTHWMFLPEPPHFRARIIKTPPKPRPTSLKAIKEAVRKAPPKRSKISLPSKEA